jgi:pre-rRNA-processing protein IPI1
MYIDREDRQKTYQKHFQAGVEAGIANARKEAGEAGRAAAVLMKVVKDGMNDYNDVENTL